MDAARPGPLTDVHAARLRAAGLRVTPQRLAVLDALATLGGHPTADEVAAALRESGRPMPRATLYHGLSSMADAGVVLVADTGPGVARFEVGSTWHHHLVCRACGRIVDVPCLGDSRPCIDADLAGAVIDEAQVVFRGLCPSCAAGWEG
jgi:Fur family ferric uptake transcriptional regulator